MGSLLFAAAVSIPPDGELVCVLLCMYWQTSILLITYTNPDTRVWNKLLNAYGLTSGKLFVRLSAYHWINVKLCL